MKKYSGYIIMIPMAIGLLTIAGWTFSIDILKRPVYSNIAMNPVTALCFVLCSIAFLLDFKREFSSKISIISAQMSVAVAAIGILRLLAVPGLDLHIDSLLFHDAVIAANNHSTTSHMTAYSAMGFVLMGSALRFGIVSGGRAKMICSGMALVTLLIGFLAFMSYVYHVRHSHYAVSYMPMAFLTSVCFICLSIAFLIDNTENVFVSRTLTSSEKLSEA
jgi:hypothetical protein